MALTNIPNVPNYGGNIALRSNPVTFPADAETQYTYLAQVSVDLNATVDATNTLGAEMEQVAVASQVSAVASQASAVASQDAAAASTGNPLGAYATGLTFNTHNDYTDDGGQLFRLADGVTPPYVTNATTYPNATDDGNLKPWSDVDLLKAVAVSLNVPREAVGLAVVGFVIAAANKYLYNPVDQTTWGIPAGVGAGDVIVSVVGSTLNVTVGGPYTLGNVDTINRHGTLSSFVNDANLAVGMAVRVTDRSDGIFDVVTSETPNTYNIIDATASGHQLKLRVIDATVNIAALGGIAGDNSVDASLLIIHAVKTMKAKEVICVGENYLLSGLDLTELGDDQMGRIRIRNIAGGTATDDLTDNLIFRHNGNIGIDLAGSSRLVFESLGIKTDNGFSPLVGIYKQRTTSNPSCKRHVFKDCRLVMGETSASVNGGYGYIGMYNYAGEDNLYDNFTCIADTPNFLTLLNELGKSSTFAGSYTNTNPLLFTVSNNRYRDSSFVSAQGNEPFVLDGVTGFYVEGSYLNARNLARLVRCVGVHSRQLYFTNPHCENIGAMLTYDADTSVGFEPTTFEFAGGQLIGTDLNTGDRWDGMFEFNTNNLVIRGLKYDIPNRPGSNVIDFIKWTGTAGTLTEVDLRFASANSSTNNVFDGLLISGGVIATNVTVKCGDLDPRAIYNTAHTTPRDLRNIVINGSSNVAFSEFLRAENPADISFVNDSGLVTPSSFFLHVTNINGVNRINGIVTLSAGDATGANFTIRFTDTFFPIRSPNAGFAIFTDLNGLYRREITSSFTSGVSLLRMDMDAFNVDTLYQAKIECMF